MLNLKKNSFWKQNRGDKREISTTTVLKKDSNDCEEDSSHEAAVAGAQWPQSQGAQTR